MTPRPWTSDERATLRRMAGQGYTDGEIARHLGRHREVVCRQRAALGIRAGIKPAIIAAMARLHQRRLRWAA